MANLRRGEIEARIAGSRHVLCLTLGALAELETAFGVADLQALGERLAQGRLSANDVVKLLGAGLRGGGGAWSDEAVARLSVAGDLPDMVAAVARLLEVSFGDGHAVDGAAGPQDPRLPQDA